MYMCQKKIMKRYVCIFVLYETKVDETGTPRKETPSSTVAVPDVEACVCLDVCVRALHLCCVFVCVYTCYMYVLVCIIYLYVCI